MSISAFVEAAVPGPLNRSVIERVCAEEKLSLFEAYDAFALDVAEKYSTGVYSWHHGDDAMNSLFTYAHALSDSGLPAFAFDVYCAFDEGEYRPEGEALSMQLVLDALKKKKEPNQTPEPTAPGGRGSS